MIISVIGDSQAPPHIARLAEEVGRELGKRGIPLVCGGLTGVMEAVCKGAKAAGGTTIGVLPGNDPGEANQWVDVPICTGLGYARNGIVVRAGRAVIAVGGAYGTLSEIAHAKVDGIPVIGLQTWSVSRDGRDGRDYRHITVAADPADAVEKAVSAARSRDSLA